MTWNITDDFNSIPKGAETELLRTVWGQTVAWRWRMPEQVQPMIYAADGREGFSMFPLALAQNVPHLSMRITFPSLGGCILPGVYTSDAGHSVVVEGPK
jgi:hypothetical protein